MTARAIDRLLPRGAEVDGTIRFDGRDVNALAGADLRRYRNQVAMIFQDPRAHVNPVRRIGDYMSMSAGSPIWTVARSFSYTSQTTQTDDRSEIVNGVGVE